MEIKEERISNETCVLFVETISIPKIDQTKKMMFAPFMVDSGCDVIIDFSYNKQVNWRDLLQWLYKSLLYWYFDWLKIGVTLIYRGWKMGERQWEHKIFMREQQRFSGRVTKNIVEFFTYLSIGGDIVWAPTPKYGKMI